MDVRHHVYLRREPRWQPGPNSWKATASLTTRKVGTATFLSRRETLYTGSPLYGKSMFSVNVCYQSDRVTGSLQPPLVLLQHTLNGVDITSGGYNYMRLFTDFSPVPVDAIPYSAQLYITITYVCTVTPWEVWGRFNRAAIVAKPFTSPLSPFLIGRMFLREPSWKYSAKLVGS